LPQPTLVTIEEPAKLCAWGSDQGKWLNVAKEHRASGPKSVLNGPFAAKNAAEDGFDPGDCALVRAARDHD